MNTTTAPETTLPGAEQPKAAQPPAIRAPLAAGGAVNAIVPQTLEQAFRLAEWIAGAGWAPKSYRIDGKADQPFDANKIAVGILHGLEVGLTPIAALQSIAVINGMPSIYGDGALALVQASGLMEDLKETPILEGTKVVGYKFFARRRGKQTPTEQQFTKADAERAHLIGKSGPWTEYEQRMYQMRARAWGLRDGFADVLRGLAIAEEAMDVIDVTPVSIQKAGEVEQPMIEHKDPAAAQGTAAASTSSPNSAGAAPQGAQAAGPHKGQAPTLADCKALLNSQGKDALSTLAEWKVHLPAADQVELEKLIEQIQKAMQAKGEAPMQDGQKKILAAMLKRSSKTKADLEQEFGKWEELKMSKFNAISEWLTKNPL